MKLDPRILKGKKPLCCIDIDEAKQFIGKKGYFAGDLSTYQKLDYFQTWILQEIHNDRSRCFKDSAMSEWWYYFLPEEWVREKEPEYEWKPYDLDSWREDDFNIGSAITFRWKPKNAQDIKNTPVKTLIYLGHEEISGDLNHVSIYIGNSAYSFQHLFEHYEIFDDKYSKIGCPKWRPFGYQE